MMKRISLVFFLLISSSLLGQLKINTPTNVRYIAGGYNNKSPYFNTLEKALNDIKSRVTAQNPYTFWIDGDTTFISDWKHGRIGGVMGMADSIEIYYAATGKIKLAGFMGGSGVIGNTQMILYLPDTKTRHYSYPKWQYGAYSQWYDSLSRGLDSIDRDIHDLIVYTDSSWLYVQNDTLKVKGNKIPLISSGVSSFSGSQISDTLFITGAKTTDIYFVSPIGPCPTCGGNDLLRVEAVTNKAIVWRNSGGAPNLSFYWIRVEK
ncbi:MAG: hypothetical protein Q8940_07185 [Bacteroidota bacterium]|nr:hypothetical protein [Bacteroidota bacterium]